MIKECNHVFLREAHETDAANLLAVSQDKEVMKYYGMAPFTSIQEAHDEIAWFHQLQRENEGFRWVIADKDTNSYIGDIGVFHFIPAHNRIEIGFKLRREYWGRGIMRECIYTVLEYSFNVMNVNRIEALVDPRNTGCQITLLRNGFKLEGTLRDYEKENGEFIDLQMYSILKSEFT